MRKLGGKSRPVARPLDKYQRLIHLPLLQCLDGGNVVQAALWDMVIVGVDIVGQGSFEFIGACEAGLLDDLADSAIEALDYAVGLKVARRGQTLFDREFCASLVEDMLTSGPLVFGCETVDESAAVVGQDLTLLMAAARTKRRRKSLALASLWSR